MVYDETLKPLAIGQRDLRSDFPKDGWVEQDPILIWSTVIEACTDAIGMANIQPAQLSGIGITNQRETSIVWDAQSSEPVYNAIVWQDRRTADLCEQIRVDGMEDAIASQTGLVVDPYFSSTKLAWLLKKPHIRSLATKGRLRWGTVDSYLLWRLTGGRVHATDATNASRTQLFDINAQEWSNDLLEYFDIPRSVLPIVQDCVSPFGVALKEWLGYEIPILGVAGDQQSALVGQACFKPGMAKTTFGTGCFLIVNTGTERISSNSGLLSTVGYRIGGSTTYAMEGSIFNAGTAIQWLRDSLGLIEDSADTERIAERTKGDTKGVYVVPAFTGLGAPHWNAEARGLISGLTLDVGCDEIVSATLKSVGFQTTDLVGVLSSDGISISKMRVDGGMSQNRWFCQFLADITGIVVDRPMNVETTSAGVAILSLLGLGVFNNLNEASKSWSLDCSFSPKMDESQRHHETIQWQSAVQRSL